MDKLKFADFFSGIGGFHQIMTSLGGECVFACEIDYDAATIYKKNYNFNSFCDINKVDGKTIPNFDVMCGGFPCQGFSIGGKKLGFEDERGTLFFQLARILREKIEIGAPVRYIVFENVKHLLQHDNGNTWNTIQNTLLDMGYVLNDPIVCNPIQLGIPQNRERILILGEYKRETPLNIVNDLPKTQCKNVFDTDFFLENVDEKYSLTPYQTRVITMWEDFKQGIGDIGNVVNAKYFKYSDSEIEGVENKDEQKVAYKSAMIYRANKEFIEDWLVRYDNLAWVNPSHHRFEWQAGNNYHSVYECFAQFRQSGLRIKKPDFFPCLVAIVQTSIIPKYNRKLTPRECARLQTFPDTFILHSNDRVAYKQLGNSICIDILKYFVAQLLEKPL